MLSVYPYEKLGHVQHGWLEARHHFSFGSYRNPNRTSFGKLVVINDDIIAPHTGFNTHSHDNMEIITYVRQGAITHKDSLGNEGRTEAGDVQVMSAGSGISHSEHNKEDEPTKLYQIWLETASPDVKPRWEAAAFPKALVQDSLPLLVSGRPEHKEQGALFIYQDAVIYGGRLAAGTSVTQVIKHQAYILASVGEFTVNGQLLKQGDGAEFVPENEADTTLEIIAQSDAELLVLDVPF